MQRSPPSPIATTSASTPSSATTSPTAPSRPRTCTLSPRTCDTSPMRSGRTASRTAAQTLMRRPRRGGRARARPRHGHRCDRGPGPRRRRAPVEGVIGDEGDPGEVAGGFAEVCAGRPGCSRTSRISAGSAPERARRAATAAEAPASESSPTTISSASSIAQRNHLVVRGGGQLAFPIAQRTCSRVQRRHSVLELPSRSRLAGGSWPLPPCAARPRPRRGRHGSPRRVRRHSRASAPLACSSPPPRVRRDAGTAPARTRQ